MSIWYFLVIPSNALIIVVAILYNFSLASEAAHLGSVALSPGLMAIRSTLPTITTITFTTGIMQLFRIGFGQVVRDLA